MIGLSKSDRGASLFMTSMALFALMGAAAIAVDLAALRLDRSADQKVTDSASSAAALAVAEGGAGQEACEAALAYVAINTEELAAVNDGGCAGAFSASCNVSDPPHTVPAGRFSVTVVYPVTDGHDLMTSAQLGAPTQSVEDEDGEPCERVGVQVSADRKGLFSQLLGFDQGTTTVHSVASAFIPELDGPPLNLAVLDRSGCDAIHVTGAPGSGVFVDAVVDPDTLEVHPGVIVADSDGSSASCSTAVIRMQGANVSLQADGRPGCPDELASGPGDGCGSIQTVADNPVPPCSAPSCTAGGGNQPDPAPTKRANPITRKQIDDIYNCFDNYASPPPDVTWASPLLTAPDYDIDPCTKGTPDHIYDWIQEIDQGPGAPFPYVPWTSFDSDCLIDSGDPDLILGPDDIYVDCPHLIIKRHVQINGDVIFDGDVTIEGGAGHLDVNNSLGAPGRAFFRGGTLTKKGRGSLTFNYTAVYMADGSQVFMEAGISGKVNWQAPDSGPFNDLALWSDSDVLQHFAGQNELSMVGVFFMPWATVEYRGTSGENHTDAQWVAYRLLATGGAQLEVTPKFEFPFKVEGTPRTILIR